MHNFFPWPRLFDLSKVGEARKILRAICPLDNTANCNIYDLKTDNGMWMLATT